MAQAFFTPKRYQTLLNSTQVKATVSCMILMMMSHALDVATVISIIL